jgi:hypothetical protein
LGAGDSKGVCFAIKGSGCVRYEVYGVIPWPFFGESLQLFFAKDLAKAVVFEGYLELPGAFSLVCLFCGKAGGFGDASKVCTVDVGVCG